MPRRGHAFAASILGVCVGLVGCSGASSQPTPVPDPAPPVNSLPVIDSIAIQGTRPKEPANFADLGESVPIVATVHDAETPANQLEYQWSAPLGAFSGTGASVVWRAPSTANTPVDVGITLKVVERYGFPGQAPAFSHDVSATAALSLHDSVAEVGGMARQFLLDFSDSSITDVPYIMRNFDLSCRPAQDEFAQVSDNRRSSRIVKYTIGSPTVTVPFGDAFCPIEGGRVQRGDACSRIPSHWESNDLSNGHYIIADGNDWISAYYRPLAKAWKLCDSQFPGTCYDATKGAPCSAATLQSIAPDSVRRRVELPK